MLLPGSESRDDGSDINQIYYKNNGEKECKNTLQSMFSFTYLVIYMLVMQKSSWFSQYSDLHISCIVTAEGNRGFMIKEPIITRNEGI